jgi:type I restriction enzyme, S subunit
VTKRDQGPRSWLGTVPAEWQPRPLWAVLERNDGGVWGEDGDEGDTVVLRSTELRLDGSWNITDPAYRKLTAAERANGLLREGDLVVTKSSGSPEHLGKTGLVDDTVAGIRPAYSNFMQRLRVSGAAFPRYVFWLLNGAFGRETLNYLGSTTTGLRNVTGAVLGHVLFPGPPLPQQRAIADFLDRNTAALDALIAKKEQFLALLAERRRAVIAQAVTKGLDCTVRFRATGDGWLRSVPAHWSVRRIKHLARLESGHTPDRSMPVYWLETNDIPWVSLNDTKWLADNDYISDTALNVNELGLANSSAHMLPARVVVFTRDATIGKAAITTRPMAVSQHIIAWVCGSALHPEYLLYVLYAMEQELTRYTMGATLRTIGMPDVRKLVTPLPPLKEQEAIAGFVAEATAQMARTKATAERQIEHLREHRQALITAAVTGQLDLAQPQEAA